jgi:hypothetical protein
MQRQFHRQQERFMKDNRKQMERIRHEMKGDWMPI